MKHRGSALSYIVPLALLISSLNVIPSWAQCPNQALEGGPVAQVTGAQVSIGLLLVPRFMIVEGYGHFQNENNRIALKHKIDAAVDMIKSGNPTFAAQLIMGMGLNLPTNHPNLQCCGEHWDWSHIADIVDWF